MLIGREKTQDSGLLPGEKRPLSASDVIRDGGRMGRGLGDQLGLFSLFC